MPTSTLASFLDHLKALDIRIWLEGEHIRVSAPAGALDDDLREALRSRKAELRAALGASPSAVASSVANDAPLSFAQQRIWFFQQLEPESAAYNLGAILVLDGVLDRAGLDASITAIVRRHEILRTTYTQIDGEPRMQLHDAVEWQVPLVDLSQMPEERRQKEAEGIWRAEQTTPFDLGRDLPLRTTLIRLNETQHHLVVTFHHIASDGTSLLLFARELAAHYGAERVHAPVVLPPIVQQYAEIARRERAWTQSSAYTKTLAYWKERLAGELTPLAFPVDRPRPALQTFRGEVVHATLPVPLTESLRALSRSHGATLPMTLLAAFNVVLHRHAGDTDLLVGLPVANRDRPETQDPIGMFVNTVVLRTDLGGNPTFGELLDRVKSATFGALAHQELPFARLLEEIRPERDLSRTPFFQVMFNMFTAEVESSLDAAGLRITAPPAERLQAALDSDSKFDMTLYVHERADGTRCVLAYNADLFDRVRMESFLTHFARVVETVVRDSRVRIGDIVLEPPDTGRVRHAMRSPAFTPLGDDFAASTIAARFRDAAHAHGARTAVVASDVTWTYAQLQSEVDRIAAALDEAAGAKPARVALLCGRGARMVSAVLGVLDQGSTYVPLDPSYPPARLSALLDDAGATIILAEPEFADLARALAGSARTFLATDAIASRTTTRESQATTDGVAYLLYTSGSSGRPKGVTQNHGNVLSYVRAYVNAIELTPDDRLTLVASYTFDASVVDMFSALLSGASLYPLDVRAQGVHEVARALEDARITVYHSTPTFYRALVQHLEPAGASSVRCVVLGGEKVYAADVGAFAQHFPHECVFVNLYGATEATIALMALFTSGAAPRGQTVSLGFPIPGMDVVLLDDQGRETPVRGELALRSRHLALGYWNAPDLTTAAFIPASDTAGARTYRTGDLAVRRPDGRFDILGRRDFQVKIRGLRIEPGEIEMVLSAHPRVDQAVVVADASDPANTVLIAFVVTDSPGSTTPAELHDYLTGTVPEYMVPSAIVVRESLPVTRTGKVDRRALPTARELGLDAREEFVAPRDPVEEMLADIWSDVLGRERIGIHDNFFALGGHSLNATQVIARVRAVSKVELPLRTLFTTPTIVGLAAAVRNVSSVPDDSAPSLRPRSQVTDDAPLSFSQERMWYLQQLIPDGTAYNMTNAALITGAWDKNAFLLALADITARHEMLRTTFSAPEGEPRQHVKPALAEIPVIEHDCSSLPVDQRLDAARSFAADIAMRPFDLERGPLWWAVIVRVDPDRYLIALVMHHIIGDLWSFGVMGRELALCYRARSSGMEPTLPPLDVQYTDFAEWQRNWLTGDRLRTQLDYWTGRLAGLSPLDLPTDRPRPSIMTSNGHRRRHEIAADVVNRVRSIAVREGVTPFMVFFAAFNALLARYTGQTDISLGVPIANRTQMGIEGLIGTFVNTLVHRNDLSGAPSFRELLHRVRGVALDAFAHQDLPFERLVRELAPERDASRAPVFQVLFNMANAPIGTGHVGALGVTPVDIDRHAAQFELAIGVHVGETAHIIAAFNTDLFDGDTIERLLANFGALLTAATREPDRPVAQLDVMPAEERKAILAVNATDVSIPAASVLVMFESWVQRTPGTIAVEFGDTRLTYAELDERANRLANHLRASGVASGDLVGVCMERSAELVVALLAVLKAGAAYVPIDPAYPRQRVKFVVDDSRARAIVTEASLVNLVSDAATLVIATDLDKERIAAASPAPIDPAPSGDTLAYVIYTSGSTGIPKGVEITHRSLVNFLLSMSTEPGIETGDTLLAVTTISFDIAGLELYVPLTTGATVILAPRDVAADGRLLRQLLERRQPTMMQATPATWRALIDAGWTGSPTLKALCGGEALPRDLAGELLTRVRELWNMYGPTETTIWSTTHRVVDASGVIPVGRPIANTRVYVLDAANELLPRGVPGELYIGGAGVARGYFNRLELTNERFLPDPFATKSGARMYRTGDKARLRADDTIEHLGRFDDQVKLRGYRIELGEIEFALTASPAVRQAALAVRQDRLAAFVVFEPGQEMTATEVRAQLRQTLPDYMIPSLVVPMDKIPLTPNGKIDRKSLPDPLRAARAEAAHTPPETQTEIVIASVWQELLGVPRVSTSDNFFELGGHSLLSMKAVHEIHQKTGWRPDARSLFFQTLGQIAAMRPDPGH